MTIDRSLALLALTLIIAVCILPAHAAPNNDDSFILLAQAADGLSDNDQLKIAALEGLMAAPAAKALPVIKRVIEGDHSDTVKARALFVLSQINVPEAQSLMLNLARTASQPLRQEAIRMIGIGGTEQTVAQLSDIYRNGDATTRNSVLNAYLIAGKPDLVAALAQNATDSEEFAAAVNTLGAMGATKQLRSLMKKGANERSLIEAYAIAGDLETLKQLAAQTDDPGQRAHAIRAIAIVGGADAEAQLVEFYRNASDAQTRDAALNGFLIGGHDEAVLRLFRASTDVDEKRKLLRMLVIMDSSLAIDVIDSTLDGSKP